MKKTTREHILGTALMLFLKKSFKAVTIKEIVCNTGVSKGAFYHYFESKEALFEEVCKHFYLDVFTQNYENYSRDSLCAFYHDVLVGAKQTFTSLKEICDGEHTKMDINHFQLIFEAMHILPNFKEASNRQEEEEFSCWKEVIKRAKKTGEINSSVQENEVAKMFVYLGDGYGMHQILRDDGKLNIDSVEGLELIFDQLYNLLK